MKKKLVFVFMLLLNGVLFSQTLPYVVKMKVTQATLDGDSKRLSRSDSTYNVGEKSEILALPVKEGCFGVMLSVKNKKDKISLGAIIYQKTETGWKKIGQEKDLGTMGSFGVEKTLNGKQIYNIQLNFRVLKTGEIDYYEKLYK